MVRVPSLILLSLMLSLVLAACAPVEALTPDAATPEIVASESFALNEPFWMAVDQPISQQDGSMRLTILDVPEDSRCPVGGNINCAWSGQVTILLQAALADAVSEVSLTLPDPRMGAPSAPLFDRYTVELLAVEPQRTSLDAVERSAYRAQLIVREGLPTATPTPVTFALGTPFWIEMDETLYLADGSLALFFLDVPEDSRCPVGGNINCVQAGQVTVRLQATLDGATSEAWMILPDANQGISRAEVFGAYTIELLAVEPERTSLDRIERSAYRAQLIVTQHAPTGEPPGTTPPGTTPSAPPSGDQPPSGTFTVGAPFWISMDQRMSQENGSLGLALIDVPEDSRCPVGTAIQCVWAGQVTILLQATLGPTAGQLSLTTPDLNRGLSRGGLFGLYTVELLAVEPEKTSTDPIQRSAYRAQLIVTEGAAEVTPMGVTPAPSITPGD